MFLRDIETNKVKKLFVGKVVMESYLHLKDFERRKKNLSREIRLLQLGNCLTSVTLVELIETEPNCTIMIQDYANGGSLYLIMKMRHQKNNLISEKEAQLIVRLLTSSLNAIYT